MVEWRGDLHDQRVVYPQPPKRGPDPVRILAWIVLGVLILVALVCCGLLVIPVLVEAIVSGN